MSDGPIGYAEITGVLESLPVLCREARRRKGLSLRSAADAWGVSFSSISRLEAGADDTGPTLKTVMAVLRGVSS